jgi:hypothetical protein
MTGKRTCNDNYEMRGSLHYATDGETVRRSGRDDGFVEDRAEKQQQILPLRQAQGKDDNVLVAAPAWWLRVVVAVAIWQSLFDVAPVLSYSYLGDDGDCELRYVFHLLLD